MQWLEELLELPGAAGNTLLRARALAAGAGLAPWIAATEAHLRLAQEAVAIYRDLGNPHGFPEALGMLGWAQLHVGKLELARANLEEARELHMRQGSRQRAADSSLALGSLALVEGQPERAREHLEDASEAFAELRDPYWIAFTELLLGNVDRLEGNDESAEQRYRASLTTFRQHDLLLMTTSVLYAFADLALLRGQHERALRLAGASDALREPFGEKSPLEKASIRDVPAAARSLVDEATAERLYQEGQAMAFDDALAYALERRA